MKKSKKLAVGSKELASGKDKHEVFYQYGMPKQELIKLLEVDVNDLRGNKPIEGESRVRIILAVSEFITRLKWDTANAIK